MPEATVITEGIQLGVETVYGTSVAANKKLQSMGVDLAPAWEGTRIRPAGFVWPTLYPPMREWAEGSISGTAVFDEIIYPLNSVLITGAITTPATGVNARLHTFLPLSTQPNATKSYTIERGDSTRAFKVTGAQFTGFSFTADKEGGISVGGTMIARSITDGITLTASPTSLPLFPMLATTTNVFLDDTWAGLGTTKMTRLFSAGFEISNMLAPVWVLDSAQTSFVALAQSEPSGTVTISQAYDAQGTGLLTQMRAGSTKFMQIAVTDTGIIEAALTRYATFKIAFKVSGPPSLADRNGVRVWEWTGDIVHDATGGYAINALIQNTTTAL